ARKGKVQSVVKGSRRRRRRGGGGGGGVQRKGMAGFCGWLDVDQSKAERNHSLMESASMTSCFLEPWPRAEKD
ncbi:hypothetical protein NQZ68_021781, partial [Dissostichus eleginoides]